HGADERGGRAGLRGIDAEGHGAVTGRLEQCGLQAAGGYRVDGQGEGLGRGAGRVGRRDGEREVRGGADQGHRGAGERGGAVAVVGEGDAGRQRAAGGQRRRRHAGGGDGEGGPLADREGRGAATDND